MWQFSAGMALMLEGLTQTRSALLQQAPRRLPSMLAGEMEMESPTWLCGFEIQDTGIRCGDISAVLTGQICGGPSIMVQVQVQSEQYGAEMR
jgi:hypothetical protein